MSKANPGSGILTSAPGGSTLLRRTPFILMTLVLVAASWIVLDLPTFVQADDPEGGTPLWSADISVVDLENGAIGAVQASDFSNQAGNAGLTAKWLYHYEYDGKLRLSFTEGADVEGHMFQVGHLTLSFAENTSGNSSFTWDDVEVDWENGQTLAARVVPGSDGDIPATGLPTISGKAQVDETLSTDTSDIADEDGLDGVSWAYQWLADDADINLATGSSYTPVAADLGNIISVKVSFTDDNGNSETLTSKATEPVIAANTPATGAPTISGTPQVRQTLTAGVSSIGDHDGITNVSYLYQWTANDVDIDGATSTSYKLTSSEMGTAIKVVVSFKDDAGNSEVATSAPTDTVENGPPDTPEITSARRAHVGMLKVNWNDLDAAASYELQYHQYDLNWLTLPHAPLNYEAHYDGSYALVDGLGYQSGYSFRVRALNDAGYSGWSGTYTNGYPPAELYGPDTSARPRLPGSPSKPQELSASSAGHLEVNLSWTAPKESGDSDVIGYRVEYKLVGTKIWAFLAVTEETTYRHKELSPGRRFYYRVSALNSHGRGQNTERVRGTSTVKTGARSWQPPVHEVPPDWDLIPEGAGLKGGDKFRLLFITSDSRDANSDKIGDYNEFVQQAAAGGHADIQGYSSDFRVLASTVAVDAIDNTGTNWTESSPGLPVYWLKGTGVADDYKDLYDGEWDDPRFVKEERRALVTFLDENAGWITRWETRTYYNFDATQGDYIYTDEHGVSMYDRHCHGYYWKTYGASNEYQYDAMPCISTGTDNHGAAKYSEYLENCGSYTTLGNPCNAVTFGRPTRILPEESGDLRPLPAIDPTLSFGYRESKPAFSADEREGPPEWSVRLTNMSDGVIAMTSVFYAMSPVFQIEETPALSVADAEATEGTDSTLDFVVTLDPAADGEVTVDYATQDGTATAGSDYTETSGTLTFDVGETSKTVSVPIIEDTTDDDGETFKLLLSNANGAVIADSEATGTINNTGANTAPTGLPTITGTSRVRETLTADITGIDDHDGLDNAEFRYQWLADDAEIAGATGSTYTLADADEDKAIRVQVSFTDDAGNNETLTSAATTAVAAQPTPAVLLTASFANVPADHNGGNFTFDLLFSENVEAGYARIRDHAFTISGATIDSARRKTQGSNQGWTVEVDPTGNGSVTITLPETTNCNASGAICTDDERKLSHATSEIVAGPPAISVSDATVQEAEGAVLVFTATLSHASSRTVTVDYATSDGSAQAGSDYTAKTGTLTFNTGDTSQTVSVTVLTDSEDESQETLTLTLSNPSQATLGDGTGTGTIENGESSSGTQEDPPAEDPPAVLLTASFANVPATHNGSNFTFDLTFSEEFGISYVTLRDDAFSVTDGEVTSARRLTQGSNQNWTITVQPNGNDAITITLPPTTDCDDTGAICTQAAGKLSNRNEFTVSGPGG